MCGKCSDPTCACTSEGMPLPFILGEAHRAVTRDPNSDEKIVTITTPMGVPTGQFIAHEATLPQLLAINESPEGGNYFFWEK
jgi:hypothetical protein